MARDGGNYKEWYVGNSKDPKQQIFNIHKFKKGDDGVTRDADYVHASKRSSHTKP
jgi:hypothetical protein